VRWHVGRAGFKKMMQGTCGTLFNELNFLAALSKMKNKKPLQVSP
jgi:hypothetical protein